MDFAKIDLAQRAVNRANHQGSIRTQSNQFGNYRRSAALPYLHGLTAKSKRVLPIIHNCLCQKIGAQINHSPNDIHEERITAQRNRKVYRGYIPMNVEFLIEYLFAVALSPKSRIDRLPVKLWGRYLPDTISYHIRQLYYLSEHDALY